MSEREAMTTSEERTFENIFNQVCSRLKSAGKVESTSKLFASLAHDFERIEFVQSLLDSLDTKKLINKETEKSEIKSISLREAGNEKFRKKRDLEALDFYTQSILFAPADSKLLALGFGNRSAVLKSLRKYEDCILDIDRALRLEFPDNLVYKILVRQGECYKMIGKFGVAVKIFQQAQEKLKIADLNKKKSIEQIKILSDLIANCKECEEEVNKESQSPRELPCKAYGQSEEITCASSCVKIEYSADFGRHLCATQDIEPGDTIIVEQPFAWILLPEYFTSHCSFCLKRCASLIPCPACTHAMFCDDDCLNAALAKYHRLECKKMSSILKLDMGKMSLLAVRVLSIAGLDHLSKFIALAPTGNETFTDEQKRTLGFNSKGQYDSLDFLPIFHLIGNSELRSVSDLFKRSLMAACLIKGLDLDSHPDRTPFGSALLRLLQNLPCNAHEVSETVRCKGERVPLSLEIGAAAYACLSLLNHSCDPNVVRHSHGNTAVLRSIKFIPKGSQILDNYGYHFAVHPRETRQLHLRTQYLFNCSCEGCLELWPLHQNLPHLPRLTGTREKIIRQASNELQQLIQKSLEGKDITLENLQKIFKHLKLLDQNEARLCQEFNCCQEIVKQYFARQGNFYP